MRRVVVRTALGTLVLVMVGLSVAQGPATKEPPKDEPVTAVLDKPDSRPLTVEAKVDANALPKTLDEMLAVAMKENPDIRVAEAKVRQAEEEVRRARLSVSQKIVATYYGIEEKRAEVKEYTARWNTAEELRKRSKNL